MRTYERERIPVLREIVLGQLTVSAAAPRLHLSERQVRRLVARYRDGGAKAVRHGNCGRQPARTIRPEVRQRIVALAQGTYRGYSHYELSELLAEREGLIVSRSSVRRILLAAGLSTAQLPGVRQHR